MTQPTVAPAAPVAATAPVAPDPTAGAPAPVPTAPATQPPVVPAAPVDLAAEVEKWKAMSRHNEAQAKANAAAAQASAAQSDLLAKVAQALGLPEATPDPAAISAKLAAAELESRTRATEIAVLRAAQGLKADGDALLDSRAFLTQLKDVDPTNLEAVKAVVAAAVAAEPARFGKTSDVQAPTVPPVAPTSTGGSFNGAPGGNRQWTAQDVKAASPAQVTKAMHDGLLRDYMATPGH